MSSQAEFEYDLWIQALDCRSLPEITAINQKKQIIPFHAQGSVFCSAKGQEYLCGVVRNSGLSTSAPADKQACGLCI